MKAQKKNNFEIGSSINHLQMGEMVIHDVREGQLEVYKKSDEEKTLKNIYVINVEDFDIKTVDKSKESKLKKDQPKKEHAEEYPEFIEDID